MNRYSIKNDRDSHTCMEPDLAGDWVQYQDAIQSNPDTVRLDWLEKQAGWVLFGGKEIYHDELRTAIDNAREKEKK